MENKNKENNEIKKEKKKNDLNIEKEKTTSKNKKNSNIKEKKDEKNVKNEQISSTLTNKLDKDNAKKNVTDEDILNAINETLEGPIQEEEEVPPTPNQEIINTINMQLEEPTTSTINTVKKKRPGNINAKKASLPPTSKIAVKAVPVEESFMIDALKDDKEQEQTNKDKEHTTDSGVEKKNKSSIEKINNTALDIDKEDLKEEKSKSSEIPVITENLIDAKEELTEENLQDASDHEEKDLDSEEEKDLSNANDENKVLKEEKNDKELEDGTSEENINKDDFIDNSIDKTEVDVEQKQPISEEERANLAEKLSKHIIGNYPEPESEEISEEIPKENDKGLGVFATLKKYIANIIAFFKSVGRFFKRIFYKLRSMIIHFSNFSFPLRVFLTMTSVVLIIVIVIIIQPINNFSHILFSNVELTYNGALPIYSIQTEQENIENGETFPEDIEIESSPEATPEAEPAAKEEKWLYASAENLSSTQLIESFADKAKTAGATAIVICIKDQQGNVYINTSNETAKKSTATNTFNMEEIIKVFTAKEIKVIASLYAFEDELAPKVDRDMAIQLAGQNKYLWYNGPVNGNGKPWLNPYSEGAQDYITSLLDSCVQQGISNILIEGLQFPDGYGLEQANLGENAKGVSQAEILSQVGLTWQEHLQEQQVKCWFEYPQSVLTGTDLKTTQANPLSFHFNNYMVKVPDNVVFESASESIRNIFQLSTENNIQEMGIDLRNTSISTQEKNNWEKGTTGIGYKEILF